MRTIHAQDEVIGDLSWTLPPNVSNALSKYPPVTQEKILGVLEDKVKQWMLILLSGIVAREPQPYYEACQRHLDTMIVEASRVMKESEGG